MNPEQKLQSECVRWFSFDYPDRRGHLFATFQETLNAAQGSFRLSLGLVKGVSDLLFIDGGKLFGIEMKVEGTQHNILHVLEQAYFISHVASGGGFCTSLDMFKVFIRSGGKQGLISPEIVIEMCRLKLQKKVADAKTATLKELIVIANGVKGVGKVRF